MSDPHAAATAHLEGRLSGSLLRPGEAGYDDARSVWNARFERSPALVVRCADEADVSHALLFARERGMDVSVKGGGHDYAGNTVAEGSLLVDLGAMDSVEVLTDVRRARVGGGAVWRQVDAATQAHGLATTGGTCSQVGVAGFTLGGGSGWLSRKHGLAVDNVRRMRVVSAAGEAVTASEDENRDLFWALRGGSGNFGVVTSFEYELHPLGPEVLAGQVFYPLERAGELLRFYRAYFREAPDELTCYPFFLRVPPIEIFPEAWHGRVVLDFVVAWCGALEEGRPHVAAFQEREGKFLEFVGPQPYVALQQAFDAGLAKGNRWFSRSVQLDELSDDAIATLVEGVASLAGDFSVVYLGPGGGAPGRVARDATAFPHRGHAHELHVFAGWAAAGADGAVMDWAEGLHQAMRPHQSGGVYVNLLGDGEEDRVPRAYGASYPRLREIKKRWDPENVFRGNHNIPPAG